MPRCRTVLIIIDVLNDLEFPGGDDLLPWAEKMVTPILAVRKAARDAGVPVIYANDNFGQWQSGISQLVRHATRPGVRGRHIARRLKPSKQDYFIIKAKNSAFFSTAMVPLLDYLGAERVVLAGIATNLCVLFSAHDAHMHEYDIYALSDCCAAESDQDHNMALDQLKRFCGTTVLRSDEIDFKKLANKPSRKRRRS